MTHLRHLVWRVSSDAQNTEKVATYPVQRTTEMEDVSVIVDDQGDYLEEEEDLWERHRVRISPF